MNTFKFWKVLPFLALALLLGCSDRGNDAAADNPDGKVVTGTGNGNGSVDTSPQGDTSAGSPGNTTDGSTSTTQP